MGSGHSIRQIRPRGFPSETINPFLFCVHRNDARASQPEAEFGGWPWPDSAPVHGAERVRFTKRADGRVETLPAQTGEAR